MIHKYHDILMAIAKGEGIQWQEPNGVWLSLSHWEALEAIGREDSTPECYRVKPAMLKIGNMEVPEPLRIAPQSGTKFFVPLCGFCQLSQAFFWEENKGCNVLLCRGLVHLTEEAATLHAQALIEFTKA